jgi:hypothetical protein
MFTRKTVTGVTFATIFATILAAVAPMMQQQSAEGAAMGMRAEAPAVVSGENVYIAWWTNKTANNNEEVMFRASTDSGATFGDKINLSNTTDAESWRVLIAGEGPNVLVSWWETNQTSDIPVARISTDSGQTFGPMLRLATNGTLGEAEDTEEEEGE